MTCWNCNATMTEKEDENHHPYYLCPGCGATQTEVPEPSFSPLAEHGFYLQNADGEKVARSQRPSRSSKRAAHQARARV